MIRARTRPPLCRRHSAPTLCRVGASFGGWRSRHRTLSTSDSTARAAMGPRPRERTRWWEEDGKERARYRPVEGFIFHIASGLGVAAYHGTTTSSGAHGSQPPADPERSHGRG